MDCKLRRSFAHGLRPFTRKGPPPFATTELGVRRRHELNKRELVKLDNLKGLLSSQLLSIPLYFAISFVLGHVESIGQTTDNYVASIPYLAISISGLVSPSFWTQFACTLGRIIRFINSVPKG